MSQPDFTIRTMRHEDVEIAVEWAAQEGWNPGLHDGAVFYTTDPHGFFIGELDNEPVATVSAVAYGKTYGFMGFYIVKPEYRNRRFGQAMERHALRYMGDKRIIGIDGVLEREESYRSHGFVSSFHSVRYRVKGGCDTPATIIDLKGLSLKQVIAYDNGCFPAARPSFLSGWIAQADCGAVGILVDGSLCGYGVIRACRKGHKIGPLFADDEKTAEAIFCALLAKVQGDDVFLDVPMNNSLAVNLAERHEMQPVFETVRMYMHGEPYWPVQRVYGVTSFELG